MTILVFWTVDDEDIERHTLDNVSDEEAFDILWHRRDELRARFYCPESSDYSSPICTGSEFEDDYNNEDLDGGLWVKVIRIDEEDVKRIIED